MTDLVKAEDVFEAIPALPRDGDPTILEKIEGLFMGMTTVPEGMEEMENRWRPEIIKMKQKMSSDGSMPGNAKEGDIWANGRVLWERSRGEDDPFLFVPIYNWLSHARFQNNERAPNCRSDDGKWSMFGTPCAECPTRPWKDGKVQDCRKQFNFIVVPLDLSGIFHIMFTKTSAKAGTAIMKTSGNRNVPLWHNVYALTSSQQTNKAGQSYYTYGTAPRFDVTPPTEVTAFGRFIYQQYKAARTNRLEQAQKTRDEAPEVLEGEAEIVSDAGEDLGGFEDSM